MTTSSTNLDPIAPTNLRGDPERLWSMLAQIAEISDTEGSAGTTRLAYTRAERAAHALVGRWLAEIGLEVWVDPVGNTIAELVGSDPSLGALGTGSHLDSVPGGGRFDGIVGVVAAIEAARLVVEQGLPHQHGLRVVAFAAEEGARFGQGCIGSKAVSGLWTEQALRSTRDRDGISIAEAMSEMGFDVEAVPEAVWSPHEWAGFVELHIEQGAVLETENLDIGVVDLISGSTRLELVIEGTASHTGSTPMGLRADALAAAAEIVLLAEGIAKDPRHRGTRCTVGRLEVEPGSITTIPGLVRLWVDVRDIDSARQRDTADEVVRRARFACRRRGVRLSARLLSDISPVVLPVSIRDVTETVCRAGSIRHRILPSGASHDSQMLNHVIPAGMLFVPSRGGLSHVPGEWTDPDAVATGVEVLLRSLLALDGHRAPARGPSGTVEVSSSGPVTSR